MPPTLFQKLLGAPFFTLPQTLRALHGAHGRSRYAGRATIVRGRNPLARLCAAIAGLPRSADDAPTTVEFVTDERGEAWHRDFGGARMSSRLWFDGDRLVERLGPVRFRFALHVNDGVLYWSTVGVRLFGVLPLPVSWFGDVRCREREHEGRYEFLVEASLPLVGPLIRYEGWLEPA